MIILGGAKRQSRAVFAAVAGRYSFPAKQVLSRMEIFFLSHCKGTTFGRGAFRLGMDRRVSSAFFCFLLDVDVEFGDDELDDVGWQYLVVGLHAHGG